jgi:hypothetical protein
MANKIIDINNKKEKAKKVDVLFTGLIREVDVFKRTLNDLMILRKRGLVDKIYLSTWKGEFQKHPDLDIFFRKNKIVLIESDEPKEGGWGNVWCQMKSLDEGLKRVNKKKFILKTRTDVYIRPEFLEKMFSNYSTLLKITKPLPNENIFKYKVWTIWFELTRPFFMSDECFFGHHDDLEKLYNYETKYDTEYKIGPGITHIRRFIHPFIQKYPILSYSLAKSSKESYFREKINNFSEKVFNLKKIKLLRKMYEFNRFRILRKRLKNDNYIDCLAAYYAILYSHFYIDSVSFPNQVIFRECATPSVEMDSENIDNNFSKDKSRLPYGGQIYVYDTKLLDNINNKKLEETAFSRRLMLAIDKFNNKN